MNKIKLQEKADALQKELDKLKAEIDKPEQKIDIYKQQGVLYKVWDGDRPKYPIIAELRSFGDGRVTLCNLYGDKDNTWQHHELHYPQWIDIPDDMMEAPEIKGKFVIEIGNGDTSIRNSPSDLYWDCDKNAEARIKRICILEKQSDAL